MATLIRSTLTLGFAGGLLAACGAKKSDSYGGTYGALPPLPPVSAPSEGTAPPDEVDNPANKGICEVWNGLRAPVAGEERFRILENLGVISVDAAGGGKKNVLAGKHLLSKLPQVRFRLSMDYVVTPAAVKPADVASSALSPTLGLPLPGFPRNGDGTVCQSYGGPKRPPSCELALDPTKSPLDPPDIEAFMKLVQQKYDCGEINGTKYWGACTLYANKGNSTMKATLIQERNKAVIEEIEKQLPGIFTGNPGSLENDQLLIELKSQLGVASIADPSLYAAYLPLVREVALFEGSDWASRRKDLARTMAFLDVANARADLSANEKVCRYALAQRATSQFLWMKGILKAPNLKANGLAVDMPTTDVASFPKHDENGIFGLVANDEWVLGQVDHPTARALNAESTQDLIESLRYFGEWASHRSPTTWSLRDENGVVIPAAPGLLQMDPRLIRLGVGFFGITVGIFRDQEIQVTPENRIHLREDTADNLALTAHLAMELVDGFESLMTDVNPLERQVLTPEQIALFTAPYPDGLVERFSMLINGIIFEGLNRLKAEQGSESLKSALRAIGWRIGNENLKNLK